jgi:hypothetical protein
MTPRILAVGTDEVLVQSRARILEIQYQTETCRLDECLPTLRNGNFHLLLVCSSIPPEAAYSLVQQVHLRYPSLYIVRLLAPDAPLVERQIAHKLITIDFHPEQWMKAVDQLLQTQVRSDIRSNPQPEV